MKTRSDYLDGRCTHREFYAQFVTQGTRDFVTAFIGYDRLRSSRDEHFNDIPLKLWDRYRCSAKVDELIRAAGDIPSQAGLVCVLKETARQLLEAPGGAS